MKTKEIRLKTGDPLVVELFVVGIGRQFPAFFSNFAIMISNFQK